VCSERILLSAGPKAIDLLPGAVRPLLEADLPFVLWWTNDPRDDEALFRDLADECSRLILDLPDPEADPEAIRYGLDPRLTPYGRDMAWFGVTSWRELVAQFFDPSCHLDTLSQIRSVQIRALSPSDGAAPRLAVWLAAWLAGQLGWKPHGHPTREPGRLTATFDGSHRPIGLEILSEVDPALDVARLSAVTLTTRGSDGASETFRIQRPSPGADEVRIEVESATTCRLPRSVHVPILDPPRRVSAALESSRRDPPFQRALPHALWLLLDQGG
jgi:glucose-6-phosphate dehydrogenase assembly protein OpcA